MNMEPGRREVDSKSFVDDPNLLGEHTRLPDLDYRALQMARLQRIAKAPGGRFEGLLAFLGQRSSGTTVDAAELDRRLRTWFEDIITRIIQAPADWDQDRVLDGKALMDYLSGVKMKGETK